MAGKALFFAPHYFTSPYRGGGQHYARAFSRLGYDVLYISNPITPLHRFFGNKKHYQERLKIHRSGGGREGNILYYVPRSLIVPHNKPFLSTRWVADNWYKFSDVLKYIKNHGFDEVDLIWIDGAPYWFILDHVKYRHSVMRIADNILGFKDVPRVFLEKDLELAERVDAVVITSHLLKKKFESIIDKDKLLVVPNGVDLDALRNMDTSFPKEFEKIPEPRVIYVGYIRYWFDTDLLEYAAKHLPHVNFVLIGDVEVDVSRFRSMDNVFFLGARPHSRIGQFLSHSQAGIIPFRRNELVEYVNPLKLYEYLFFGLPTITSYWGEIAHYNHLCYVSRTPEEFVKNIVEALKKGKVNIDLEQFDWKNKARYILEKLEEWKKS